MLEVFPYWVRKPVRWPNIGVAAITDVQLDETSPAYRYGIKDTASHEKISAR
jgi:hypothetical protein